MRVGVRRDRDVALTDLFADTRPRHPARMEEADPSVSQIVRTEERHPRRPAGLRDRGAEGVRARVREQAPFGVTVLTRTDLLLDSVGEDRVRLDPQGAP